jgi:hypothetical protein
MGTLRFLGIAVTINPLPQEVSDPIRCDQDRCMHFWVEGDAPAQYRVKFRPALRIKLFVETLFGLARDGRLDKKGMSALLQLAVLVRQFGDEIRPTRPHGPCCGRWPCCWSPWHGGAGIGRSTRDTAAPPPRQRLGKRHTSVRPA